jgi:molybdopterin-containing oxidoreductase family iron-sulfur binding subunit
VHARVHRLNAKLGNVGQTVTFIEETQPERPDYAQAIAQLADEMRGGNVDTLVILRGNPVYDAPADVKFAEALAKVPNAIHLSEYHNETSALCRWYLPATHAFEQWGDGRSYDGTLTLQQPLIEPLHGGRSDIEFLAMLLGEGPRRGEQIVRETFGGDEAGWKKALHDGFVADSAPQPVDAAPTGDGGDQAGQNAGLGKDEFELVFCESQQVYDGRFANNGWLQEAPDFLTKLTWDNAAILSWTDAANLKVKNQDVVRLTVGGASVELPVYVLPGQAVGSIGVALGYGRTAAGLVGGYVSSDAKRDTEPVGQNVYPLRTTKTMHVARGVKVETTGKTVPMAITQDHFAIDTLGQQEIANRVPVLVREGTEAAYREFEKEPHAEEGGAFAHHLAHVHHPPLESMWQSPDYAQGHAWGMAIDLSKCIGCNACVVACQSENNVPVVGKDQVLRGREMHWLRIDRYFRGRPEVEGVENKAKDVKAGERGGVVIVGQPVLCMHCEHAPCEQVCPVAAAVHDTEGLNLMVYNRCVGTRYCNNNCPYKVRRFNFLNFAKEPANKHFRGLNVIQPGTQEPDGATVESLARMVENPEVTVRSRGVMEKCTYCIQRIQNAKIEARNESVREGKPGTHVPDGAIQTACGQACPTNAIVFGDLLDENSRVYKLNRNPRIYAMLEELNVRPRTRYLARVRNPHPDLAEHEAYYHPATGHASEHHDDAAKGRDEEETHHT